MITEQVFDNHICTGKPLIYDYGFGEFCLIEPLHITQTKKNTFWFEARLIDNSNMSKDNQNGFYKLDNRIHSFSNAFIYETIDQMKEGQVIDKANQIAFVKKAFGL